MFRKFTASWCNWPLPKHLSSHKVIEAINPDKDVDGFHEKNVGALVTGETPFPSCTPYGVMVLLEKTGAMVVGRSNIVGKPMALLLLRKNATVTICTSKNSGFGQTHTKTCKASMNMATNIVAAIFSIRSDRFLC